MRRSWALAVALSALLGLGFQFWDTMAQAGSVGVALWLLLRFFTIVTNVVVGVVFAGVAAGARGFGAAWLVGGAVMAILLVGAVNALLLRGLVPLQGVGRVADVFLHDVTPVAAALFWVVCQTKGGLRARDPLIWAAYPLVYLAYALGRGVAEGKYPYPFIDVGRIGWGRTGVNAVAIAMVFMVAGYGMVWLDGWLARRRG